MSSLQKKQLRTSEPTSFWKALLPDSLGRNNLGFQSYQIRVKHSPNRQWQKWNKCNNNVSGSQAKFTRSSTLQTLQLRRFVFLQSFKRMFASNVTHHSQFSFTTLKYCFLPPQKGQWMLSDVEFLWCKTIAILDPKNSSHVTTSISSHLKPNFSRRTRNTMEGHYHKFLVTGIYGTSFKLVLYPIYDDWKTFLVDSL